MEVHQNEGEQAIENYPDMRLRESSPDSIDDEFLGEIQKELPTKALAERMIQNVNNGSKKQIINVLLIKIIK